ncbi:MAG: ribosome maturation factor RimM [Pseudomonadota bacterium]
MTTIDRSRVVLGKVSGIYGVRGWVKLYSYTDPKEALLNYTECFLEEAGAERAAEIEESKPHGKSLIAKFAGVVDRDRAQALIGASISVPRAALPALEDGHYYWADLEGLEVRRQGGDTVGTVSHLMATGANDVLVVAGEGQEVLIPFVMGSVILDVDLQEGLISVDWEWD